MSEGRGRRTVKVGALARVEGEGGLYVRLRGDVVEDVQLRIYEPPRFFEAFLRGRRFSEAPDLTARICGICPVAYQMSAVQAIEAALGVTVGEGLRELRRLVYCGEWIESHVLHVAMLHAPDFLGYESAVHMARDHPEMVQLALKLKKVGNDLVTLAGGREIHPVNVKVGGFHKVPRRADVVALAERLKWASDAAVELTRLAARFDFPDFEQDYEFVALRHPREYPLNEGRLVSNRGLDIPISDYDAYFHEEHVPHSNALHSGLRERGVYLVGPLARYNLNFDRLGDAARDVAGTAGLGAVCRNPFKSILVRCVEVAFAVAEALRIVESYEEPDTAAVEVVPREGIGHGCTEAPRGILYHQYKLDSRGLIEEAKIVPPTAQNQKVMENDLRNLVPRSLDLTPEALQWRCEQAVRNYDPCISCATHFLKFTVARE